MNTEALRKHAEERLREDVRVLQNIYNSQYEFVKKQQQKYKEKTRASRHYHYFYFYLPKEYSYLINNPLVHKVTKTTYPQFEGYNLYQLVSFHMLSFNVLKQKIAAMVPLEFVKIPPQHLNNKRFLKS